MNCKECRPKPIDEIGKVYGRLTVISKESSHRNDGACALCGGKVNLNDYHLTDDGHFVAHNYYPSIDHIIPLSKGGTHTWDNVQLAHLICNSIKGVGE